MTSGVRLNNVIRNFAEKLKVQPSQSLTSPPPRGYKNLALEAEEEEEDEHSADEQPPNKKVKFSFGSPAREKQSHRY